jgi:uncharacterized protein with HEPN domain
MSEDDTPYLLLDMLLAARAAVDRTQHVTWQEFERDPALQDAVMRPIQIIGEAADKIRADFQEEHPEIPWHDVIGMRHRLVHDYRRIDREIVWDTARNALPSLIVVIEALVPPPDQEEGDS